MLNKTLQSAVGAVKSISACRDHSVRHGMYAVFACNSAACWPTQVRLCSSREEQVLSSSTSGPSSTPLPSSFTCAHLAVEGLAIPA